MACYRDSFTFYPLYIHSYVSSTGLIKVSPYMCESRHQYYEGLKSAVTMSFYTERTNQAAKTLRHLIFN
jgi:hypothetical protein